MENQKEQDPVRRRAVSRQKSRARRKRREIWIFCILAITASIGILVLAAYYAGNLDVKPLAHATADIQPDGNAVKGILNAGEGAEVKEGDYWIVLNQLPTMEAGSRECNIQFENPRQNHFTSRLTLFMKSTGERLGGTALVDTGMYVETIQLSRSLEPGEYPLQASIELFSGTEPAGEMMLEITLRIVEKKP